MSFTLNILDRFFNIGGGLTASKPEGQPFEEYLKKKHRAYMKASYRSDMQISKWEAALDLAESGPHYDHYPLYRLYRQAFRDLQVKSGINTAINMVLEEPAVVLDEAGNIDEAATNMVESLWFDNIIRQILLAEFWGTRLLEMHPGHLNEAKDGFQKIYVFKPWHVNPKTGLVLPNPENPTAGIPYRKEPYNEYLLELGDNENLGLLQDLIPEAVWKGYSRSDISRLSEHFGLPWIIGFLASWDDEEAQKFVSKISASGNQKVSAMEADDKVDLKIDTRSDPGKLYDRVIDRANEEISKGINGQTETSDSSDSSGYAQSKTHFQILKGYTRARMKQARATVTDKVFPFLAEKYGFPLEGMRYEYMRFLVERQVGRDPEGWVKREDAPAVPGGQMGQFFS